MISHILSFLLTYFNSEFWLISNDEMPVQGGLNKQTNKNLIVNITEAS